jgi:hypothetical protein
MFSELSDLLEPRRRVIQPQLLAAIQCVRRWQKAGLGDISVDMKGAISDEEMELLYGVSCWDDDDDTSTLRIDTV